MSDLSNLLGDLYGDSRNPDGPPVRHEPAAADRTEWSAPRTDDDLAAALSAALAEPPAAPAMPQVAPAPVAEYVAPAPVAEYVAPAPAPVAPVAPVAQSWTSVPESVEMSAPSPVATMPAGPRLWLRGDDDIMPISGGAKKKRK